MNVIQPLTITDAILTYSNVPENDYAAWSSGTTYAIGDRVIKTSTHKIYEAVAASTNKDPALSTSSAFWVEISATNRWKAFDQKIGQQVSQATNIIYHFAPTSIVDRIAFFGLSANLITIVVKDSGGSTIQTTTLTIIDRTDSVTWFSWLLDPIIYDTEALSVPIPGYVGNTVEVTVANAGTAMVGQIVMGRTQTLGQALVDTRIGFEDYSRIERNAFGEASIVQRSYTDTVEFSFAFPLEDARRVKRVVTNLRAVPSVYFTGANDVPLGTLIYGIHQGFSVPLQTSMVFATLNVEGLT